MSLIAIDIYCGCGGMSVGASLGVPGLTVKYGLDYDRHACSTFARNHPEARVDCRDVAAVTAREILGHSGVDSIDYLLTGPSCQAVSTMGLFYTADSRNLLFVHLCRILSEFQKIDKLPRNIVLENVPGLVYQKNLPLVRDLLQFIAGLGYRVGADVVSVAAMGVPQLRYRFFLYATLSERPVQFPAPRHADQVVDRTLLPYRAVGEAISDLFEVPVQESDAPVQYNPSACPTALQKRLRSRGGAVANHWCSATEQINIDRVATVPQGGSWKDIPASLLPERFHRVRMTDYHTLYGRLHESNPAYTISAAFGNVTSGCFTHPRQNRALSVREGCRIQGFPDDFIVLGPKNTQYRQIGNAVPPLTLAELIAFWESSVSAGPDNAVDPRITLAVLESGQPLPVFAPRFQGRKSDQGSGRKGYGSGTFWPRGWGKAPDELPAHEANYRKVDDPLVFRRTIWRSQREEGEQEAFFGMVKSLDTAQLAEHLRKKSRWVVQVVDKQDEEGLFRTQDGAEAFSTLLCEITALVLGLKRPVLITTDFSYTAERLASFLERYLAFDKQEIRVSRMTSTTARTELASVKMGSGGGISIVTRTELQSAGVVSRVVTRAGDRIIVHFSPFAKLTDAKDRKPRRWGGLLLAAVSKARLVAMLSEAGPVDDAGPQRVKFAE